MCPFEGEVKREIGERDNWTCRRCGRSFKQGYLVDLSHNPDAHALKHTNPVLYNSAESGGIECKLCHLTAHAEMNDWRSAGLIANAIWRNGLRHYSHYYARPELLEADRLELVAKLSQLGAEGKVHINTEAKPDYYRLKKQG